MRKQLLLLKTLLVAMLLGVGTSAWGDITYNTTLVNQNFSTDASISTNWTTASGMAMAKTLRSGENYYCTMSFGNSGNAASTADYSLPSLAGYDAFQLSFLWGLYSCSATSRSSLFKIVGSSGDFATTGYVAGGSSSVTLTCGETATSLDINQYSTSNRGNANRTSTLYKITVEGIASGDDAGIYLTITSEDGNTSKLARTKISSTYQTITSLHFESGQYYGQQAIDDVLLKAYSASDIVSTPTIAITGVSGTNRTVTVTPGTSSLGNDVTTYYTIDGTDPTDASSEYTTPLTITSNCTVKAICKTSAGTSTVGSLAVATGAVALASPSVALSSYVSADANYIISPTITIYEPDNKDVLLKPATETLEYTFTPEGGTESARTAISSGATYTPTAKGTLKVYANTTGYSESSYSIPVSNFYSVKTTLDYAGLYTEAQGEWTDSGNAWGYTAYNVYQSGSWPSSGLTYNRLNIRNNNTIDYVVGYGFGRFGNSYSFRIRNQVKGNFFNVISSTVAASPVTANNIIFCTSGAGADGDVANTPSIAAKNVIKTIYEYEPCDAPTIPATITDAGYATFSSTYAVDCEHLPTGVEAYIVTGDNGNSITTQKVETAVAAGTGLILKGDADTYNIPVAVTGTDYSSTNKLWAITSDGTVNPATDANYTNYVLAKQNGKVVFAPITGSNSAPVKEGQAALSLYTGSTNNARALRVTFGSDVTGISDATRLKEKGQMTNGVFNLNGQRMKKAAKGLYIVNGKKYIK